MKHLWTLTLSILFSTNIFAGNLNDYASGCRKVCEANDPECFSICMNMVLQDNPLIEKAKPQSSPVAKAKKPAKHLNVDAMKASF